MQQRLFALIVLLTSFFASCEDVVILPAYDYNYTTSNLLSVVNSDDEAFPINLPFSIRFQGTSYTRFYICSNSFITFGRSSTANYNFERVRFPKLLIDAANNVAISMTVNVAANNVTIHYFGKRYGSSDTGVL